MRKLWQISRSDKKERCAGCLRYFKRNETQFKDPRFNGERFRNVGVCCRKLYTGSKSAY